mmetsp:Transcript_19744/g.19857  ORF Transcript_19744/g.19857 Transcript_19744/m.19857 type:complete len:317 (+) Transcript_19744:156-1106(+)
MQVETDCTSMAFFTELDSCIPVKRAEEMKSNDIHEIKNQWYLLLEKESIDMVDKAVDTLIAQWYRDRSRKFHLTTEERRQKAVEGANQIVNARQEERKRTGLVIADQYFTIGVTPLIEALSIECLRNKSILEFGGGTGIITSILESLNPKKIIVWEIDPPAIKILRYIINPDLTQVEEKDFTLINNWHEIITNCGGPCNTAIIANPPYFTISLIKYIIDENNIQDVILYIPRRRWEDFSLEDGWCILGQLNQDDFIPEAPSTKEIHTNEERNIIYPVSPSEPGQETSTNWENIICNHLVIGRGIFVNRKINGYNEL